MKFMFPLTHKTSLHYRPDIDGLRAVAILLVILFHAIPETLPSGFVGVDIFFVISGYLITGILLKDLAVGHFSYLHFYARRFRRIIPALIVVLASVLLIGWFLLMSEEYSNVARNIVAGATFTTNLILLRQAGYFDWSADLNPLLHLWSLGIEEQFYLLWPPILLFIFNRSNRIAIYTLLLLVISFGLNVYFVSGNESKVFYLLPTRFWELLVGCLLAISENSGKIANNRLSNAKSAIGAMILIASIYFINKSDRYPGWWALMPTISAFLIISAGPRALLNRTLLANKSLILIGLISYPLYLWHWPLLSIARIVEGKLSATFALGILGLSAILAFLTWKFIELPAQIKLFRHSHKVQRDRYFVGGSLALIFLICSFGLLIVYKGGFPNRYPEYESALKKVGQQTLTNPIELAEQSGQKSTDCQKEYGLKKSVCFSSGPNPSIALIGDSHAMQLFVGMTIAAEKRQKNVILLGWGACPPLLGVNTVEYGRDGNMDCINTLDDYERIFSTSLDTIKTVVLASRGPAYISGHDFNNGRYRWGLVSLEPQDNGKSQRALYLTGLSRTISFLEAKGKQVIFFIDNPELGFSPASCMVERPVSLLHTQQKNCSMPTPVVNSWEADYKEIISELKSMHPKLKVFDSTSYWCNQKSCFISKNGELLYLDNNHLNFQGSKFIAEKFFAWLETADIRANGTVQIHK